MRASWTPLELQMIVSHTVQIIIISKRPPFAHLNRSISINAWNSIQVYYKEDHLRRMIFQILYRRNWLNKNNILCVIRVWGLFKQTIAMSDGAVVSAWQAKISELISQSRSHHTASVRSRHWTWTPSQNTLTLIIPYVVQRQSIPPHKQSDE